jgi:hypothetical protein
MSRPGRQHRKRPSCPNQASRGSICQASATKVRSNVPRRLPIVEAGSNTATGLTRRVNLSVKARQLQSWARSLDPDLDDDARLITTERTAERY